MPYDQPLKDLLHAFFADFLESFFPDLAARLDLSQITFLEQEASTGRRRSPRRRRMDVIAQAHTRQGVGKLIVILLELQARPEHDFPWRLFEYYTLLRRIYGLDVVPIVLYVHGGQGEERWDEYREGAFDEVTIYFRYRRLRLKGMKAREAVESGGPLVCALAPLMDRRGADPVWLKARGLARIGAARLSEARRWVLSEFVEEFLPLTAEQKERYHETLTQEEYQMAKLVDYEAWSEARLQEGLQKGLQEGQLRAKREDLLLVLRTRFGEVPAEWEERVAAIETLAGLDALFERALTASSLEELGESR